MSMSIASLKQLSTHLTAVGRDHVVIDDNGSIGKTTHWWFGRWINRVSSYMFHCVREDNMAVCDKFLTLIKNTPGLGRRYATLAREMLDAAERLSGDKPLSGRKAAKVLERVLFLAQGDTPKASRLYRRDVEINIQRIAEAFGKASIPYARFLVAGLTGTKGAFSKNELRTQLPVIMSTTSMRFVKPIVDGNIREVVTLYSKNNPKDDYVAILKKKIHAMQEMHLWQRGNHPISTWMLTDIGQQLEELLAKAQPGSEAPVDLKGHQDQDTLKDIDQYYGKDALPYAQEYLSLFPSVTQKELQEVMANTYKRLYFDAREIACREIVIEEGGRSTNLAHFIEEITAERGDKPRPIDQWMWSVLISTAKDMEKWVLFSVFPEA